MYTALCFDLATKTAQDFIPHKCRVSNQGKVEIKFLKMDKIQLKAKLALAISFLFKD